MTRRVLAIIIALVIASFGAIGAVAYAAAADSRAVAGQQTAPVFLANAAIPAGTTAADAVAKGLMTQQQVVAKGVPAGALTVVDDSNKALVATTAITAGEIVMSSRFGTTSAAETAGVPDGKVAITVNLADPERVAPLLRPGSHIVIYDSFNPRSKTGLAVPDGGKLSHNAPGQRVTRVLLPDVQVIGVGAATIASTAQPGADSGAAAAAAEAGGALVTVAVTPEQALALVHAIQTGTLYAGLRGKDVAIDERASASDTTILAR